MGLRGIGFKNDLRGIGSLPHNTTPPSSFTHPPQYLLTYCLFHSVIAYNQITGSGWLIFHRVIQGYPLRYTLYSFQIVE